MPEVYWPNDVADHAHQTRHRGMLRHSGVYDGEATKGGPKSPSLFIELVDYQRPCHVHFALPRCLLENSFGQ